MSAIVIDEVSADGQVLECDLRPRGDVKRFFTGKPFEVDYDRSIEGVPEGVLAIPALAHVCPVAWANGADVYADEVDATFARALADVRDVLDSMYDFIEGGELYARRTIDPEPDARGESALLFTGGVDSTYSYVRHRDEEPILTSIRGWTITPDPADDGDWADLTERVSAFADERGLETAFLETNALSALDHAMLLAHYRHRVDGSWYSSVGHGLGLLGLCAPMAYARGVEDMYVAATHWEGIDLEWGSCPEIDDRVRWSGTRCHHDGYELTRQERIDAIADYVDSEAPTLELQTCNRRMDGNCGECEKCYRTAVGLRLSGLDPTARGYPFSHEEYDEIRRSLESGAWELGEDERYMWADIRDRARETEPTSAAERQFFEWLSTADLEALVSESASPLSHRLLRAGARNAPASVYDVAYPTWRTAKSTLERVRSR
ncbi:hypothetical protein [Natronobacterium texcoconense]|uniref:7-cyano-7-deazaguanine synthase (Queuosine biosynthesis) n=1 Tax=Natronobacterium texcoconense TaxID=1095778 RepID=A0A1H1F2I8_NATTX|nr:hypothetical protein [Natronobacterium texcoconense]SDQ94994.1 hypothetical protein SAMN04489842_1788 [Natronobacterium texcoconense]